jgi:hypothetical protein
VAAAAPPSYAPSGFGIGRTRRAAAAAADDDDDEKDEDEDADADDNAGEGGDAAAAPATEVVAVAVGGGDNDGDDDEDVDEGANKGVLTAGDGTAPPLSEQFDKDGARPIGDVKPIAAAGGNISGATVTAVAAVVVVIFVFPVVVGCPSDARDARDSCVATDADDSDGDVCGDGGGGSGAFFFFLGAGAGGAAASAAAAASVAAVSRGTMSRRKSNSSHVAIVSARSPRFSVCEWPGCAATRAHVRITMSTMKSSHALLNTIGACDERMACESVL